jgi:hypothetical protein
MPYTHIGLLLNEQVVSDGFSFRAIFNWWEVALFISTVILIVFFIKNKRK